MAQLHIDPLKYLGNLPYFDGNMNDLQNVCDLVDIIYPFLLTFHDGVQCIFIDIIKSKLKDRAKLMLDKNCEATSWSKIKEILVNNFSDKKSCEELFDDLRNTVFKTNCVDFYRELMEKLRRLNNKTLITKGTGIALDECTRNNRRLALYHFMSRIPEPMKSILVCRDPESIEDAMDILFKAGYAYYGNDYKKFNQRNESHEKHPSGNRNRNSSRNENNYRNPQQYNSNNNNGDLQYNGNNRSQNSYDNRNQTQQANHNFNRQYNNNHNYKNHNRQPTVPINPFTGNPIPPPEPMEIGHLVSEPNSNNEVTNFHSRASGNYRI